VQSTIACKRDAIDFSDRLLARDIANPLTDTRDPIIDINTLGRLPFVCDAAFDFRQLGAQ
jgi:hypothetical protein